MTTPTPVKTRPIRYSDWQRHWYRLLDYVQGTWLRFSTSRWGRWTVIFLVRTLWVLLRMAVILAGAVLVVGFGVLFVFLSTCLGSSSFSKAASRANR